MITAFKPFRLINDQEIACLQERLAARLQNWNKEHALFPLSSDLQRSPVTPLGSTAMQAICDTSHYPLALMINTDLSAVKYSLFADVSSSFERISHGLFIKLIGELLETPVLPAPQYSVEPTDWFYKGSASLCLVLSTGQYRIELYLHPQWVLSALSVRAGKKPRLGVLDDALQSLSLSCQVELLPMSLSLDDLLNLQVGDVLSTDHPLDKPLSLACQNHGICLVRAGADGISKTIQIESSL